MAFKRLPVIRKLFKEHSPKIAFRALAKMAPVETSWSIGPDTLIGRYNHSSFGTMDAAVLFTGYTTAELSTSAESFNGTAWSATGSIDFSVKEGAGCGTQSAGLGFGGDPIFAVDEIATTREYNGATWSAGGNLSVARRRHGGCGTQTAGLAIGGIAPSTTETCEEYNGTAWSSGGDLASKRYHMGSFGIQNSAIAVSGWSNSFGWFDGTEEYNGTAWSAGGNNSQGVAYSEGAGANQNSGVIFGGNIDLAVTKVDTVEEYNGSSWTTKANLNTPVCFHSGAGVASGALKIAGLIEPGSTFTSVTEILS